MRRRDWRDDDRYNRDDFSRRGENNFDRMYDAREYRDDYYDRRNDYDRRRDDYSRREEEYEYEQPRKRSFFKSLSERRREKEQSGSAVGYSAVNPGMNGANQFVVTTPKTFEDIQGVIDNLKMHRALIVDLSRLNSDSVQRVMDYINGAIYAIDGSIQRINPAVFLLTPTGMSISVPIDYIKEKLERNKRK